MNKNKESLLKSLNLKINKNSPIEIFKEKKGVTLVALVVTIVVLMILGTVSIDIVLGEDGIIKKSSNVKELHTNSIVTEEQSMNVLFEEHSNAIKTETEGKILVTAVTEVNHTGILAEDTLGNQVYIPGGFKVHEDSANVVNEGIVITDGTNEFVWVPVSEESFNEMFKTADPAVALTGTTGVTSSYYSNLRQRSGDSYTIATVANGKYSSTSTIREPDLVTQVYNSETNAYEDEADLLQDNYSKAGFKSTAEMVQAFVDDYTNMRASIEKYDGFYIGRYELTGTVESPRVKAGAVLTADSSQAGNWYGLYKACRDVKKNDKNVTSTMIWGCQWDETMNWLKNTKFKGKEDEVDSNSSSWGNYKDVSVKASDGETEIKASGTGKRLETGITTYTMVNKIYDLAGNCYDWTQEAISTDGRVARGR